jgi:predicted nucleic acid-binding protein
VKSTVIDAGPLIALFDRSDAYHKKVSAFMMKYKSRLITTWPVITEAAYFLSFNAETQCDFYKWIYIGGVEIFGLDRRHLERIMALTKKYSDIPMDFADASLVVLAEEHDLKEIISIDSDFDVYRTLKKVVLKNALR